MSEASDRMKYRGIDQCTELRDPPLIGDLLVLTKTQHEAALAEAEERVVAALRHGPAQWSMTDAIVGGKTHTSCVACSLPWPHAINWHAVVTGEGEQFGVLSCEVNVSINGRYRACTLPHNHYGSHEFTFEEER